MAAVPPPSDDGDPDSVAFGIPVLDDRIRDASLSFPIRAADLVDELDDPEIPYDPSGRSIRLSTALERTDRQRFESSRELLNELHPVLEAERENGGLGAWLRRLFPF